VANLYRLAHGLLLWAVLALLSLSAHATSYTVGKSGGLPVCNAPPISNPCTPGYLVDGYGCVEQVKVTASNCERGWSYNMFSPALFVGQTNGTMVPGAPACPLYSAEYGGSCYCADGYKQSSDGMSCVSDANKQKCLAQSGVIDNYYTRPFSSGATTEVCPAIGPGAGCTAKIIWDVTYSVNGVKFNSGESKYTGKTCSSSAASNAAAAAAQVPPTAPTVPIDPGTPGAPAPNPCPRNTYPGEVNGVSVCVPPSSSAPVVTTNTTTTTTPAPPGSPSSAPITNSTTNQTSCAGSTCTTTTTTTTTPAGGDAPVTTTTTTEEAKDDFCTKNPKSPQCIVGSFGGSCTAGFQCEGDAVQCAIANEIYSRNCKLIDSTSPESELYDQSKTQTGSVTGDLPGSESVTIGATSFDQTAHFASSGLADLILTVAGKDVTIKLSELNTWLQLLGNLGVAVTLLVAIRISLGGAV